MIPGELIFNPTEKILINASNAASPLEVTNKGDRSVQVGSHFHFAEANADLEFDRQAAQGKRLDIPAGTAVRLEPRDSRTVELIDFGGHRKIYGFNAELNAKLNRA